MRTDVNYIQIGDVWSGSDGSTFPIFESYFERAKTPGTVENVLYEKYKNLTFSEAMNLLSLRNS